MGSSPSFTQAQCPVNRLQLPIRCQRCDNKKVKWKCEECVLVFCDKCGNEDHDVKGHNIIDITKIQVKISDVKEYQTEVHNIKFIAAAHNNSLWIGNGCKDEGGSNPFTALQNVKLLEDKVKVKSSFNMTVRDIAVTPNNDILLVTWEPRLKQIKAGSNKVTDSILYCEGWSFNKSVHVTKDGRMIVRMNNVVVVMDTDGKHLTMYEKDENNQQLFWGITSITSTTYGNIFVACIHDRKVVVLKKTEIISIYRGHPTVNHEYNEFYPSSLVTTPMGNVIVADSQNHTIHILDNTGHLLTTYNTADIGIQILYQLAITTEGSFTVLYMTGSGPSLYKMVITGC